jgi:redox-sensitive bicupin YhaK (pirin superfamily)
MGHDSTLGPGTAQLMSAGTGVAHSEFNASKSEPVHFLQIWIEPAERGTQPRYQELPTDANDRANTLRLIASPAGGETHLAIGADASVYVADLSKPDVVSYELAEGRVAYVHVATGQATINGQALSAGDAIAIEAGEIKLGSDEQGQVLLFDLPA